jgi:hypothetical protein
MKICSVGVEFFHVDGETDMTKVIIAFRNFANAPKLEASVSFENFVARYIYYTTSHDRS